MKESEKISLWLIVFLLGVGMTSIYFDHREINELRKTELRLQNEKLRIEIQILESK